MVSEMKIGFIGCGKMGGNLAKRFANAGHSVKVSARKIENAQACADQCEKNVTAGSVREAASFGDIVVLAVPYKEIPSALKNAGDLSGKILLDVTNALKPNTKELAVGYSTSAAEEISKIAPQAKVVKAFNTVLAEVVENPSFGAHKPSIFVASDDKDAKKKIMDLANQIGFKAYDAGPLKNARLLEPLGKLDMDLSSSGMGTGIALELIQR
ncbi:MAG: NADPH-dependent F420 reductase [Thaumarchaeota archaeon]|nr:NADPH-dependent F420 reductase [Nitrososphaerota archaeon]